MAAITDYEAEQIEKANATGRTPVVFIHGLWLLPSSLGPLGGSLQGGGLRPPRAHLAR